MGACMCERIYMCLTVCAHYAFVFIVCVRGCVHMHVCVCVFVPCVHVYAYMSMYLGNMQLQLVSVTLWEQQ